jgi:hypothetical protein
MSMLDAGTELARVRKMAKLERDKLKYEQLPADFERCFRLIARSLHDPHGNRYMMYFDDAIMAFFDLEDVAKTWTRNRMEGWEYTEFGKWYGNVIPVLARIVAIALQNGTFSSDDVHIVERLFTRNSVPTWDRSGCQRMYNVYSMNRDEYPRSGGPGDIDF